MNRLNAALLSAALLCGLAAVDTAEANGRHHHGHGHGRAHVGVFIGGPVFPYYAPYYSPYYYPRYYYPPAVVAAPSAPVYIEQGGAAPAPASAQNRSAYWYYCTDSQTYYPYVQQCASPWQQVVPQNPPG